ncbi:MAG: IS4 family transposase [Methanosarcinaceae archaeon]
MITLPAKRKTKSPVRSVPAFDKPPDTTPIKDSLASIGPITLKRVTSKTDRECWKAYLQTYHYLGYRHPVGAYIGYIVVSQKLKKNLGCLLFSASAAWALAPRDKWIGWELKHRRKLLHLILSNNRFLIFPWVNVPNLASKILSIATKQIGDDWVHTYGYRPVLIETFVDTSRYSGKSYQAANWQNLGKTKGLGRLYTKGEPKKTIKDIYVYPLQPDWKQRLTQYPVNVALKKQYRNDLQSSNTRSVGDDFIALWEKVIHILHEVAAQYDNKWRIRKRVIDSLMLMLLIFRLVSSKNSQSYGTTIDDLWDSCAKLELSLPQKSSIAPSSFCEARKKLDESIFKCANRKILDEYGVKENFRYKWFGHRLFAVDGSKINLPRNLANNGYKLPSNTANYPQGLLSTLYQLKSQLPFDFTLVSHANERECAKQHLEVLEPDDVVVYDRGYFSYYMLHQHNKTGVHAIFRLPENSFTVIRKFFKSPKTDKLVTIFPSSSTLSDIRSDYPDLNIIPLKMRLIKYKIGNTTYCLGTTLVEEQHLYQVQDFMDVYHARWGVEELYKVSKRIFIIEDFHAKTERGVKQEIFAHFVLITMNRLFANQADIELNQEDTSNQSTQSVKPDKSTEVTLKIKTNFKNCIHVFMKSIEELLLLHEQMSTSIQRTYKYIVGQYQKTRPNRSYDRKSMRPHTKWRPGRNKKKKLSVIEVSP